MKAAEEKKRTTTEEEVVLNVQKVPRSLREHFKILCIESGITMQEGIVRVLKQAVDRNVIL